MSEKMYPHSIDAEEGVLGSLIIDPEAIVEVHDVVRPDDFYRDAHRTIYAAIVDLYLERTPADLVTLPERLEKAGKLEEVGGFSHLASLMNHVPTSANAAHYAHIVARKAQHRRRIQVAGRIAALSYEESDDAQNRSEQLLASVDDCNHGADFFPLADVLLECMDDFDRLKTEPGTIVGVPSGFHGIDRKTAGFQKSDLILLAARPGVGKTTLAQNIAYNAMLKFQMRVAFFSLEMSRKQLAHRFIAMDSRIDSQRIRAGWIDTERDEWKQVADTIGVLSEGKLWIDDTSGLDIDVLRSRARRIHAQEQIDLIIVDYLQQMRATIDGKRPQVREREISEIALKLKQVARDLNIPVLALAQLNREGEKHEVPQLSDLRECVVGSTRLIDAKTGRWKPIIEVQAGDEILGLGENQKIGCFTVQDTWTTGTKPVFCLTTRTGRQLVATSNHPLLTATGWKPLGELQPGDCIATAMRLPEHGQEIPERADLCRLLGYMVGDGTYQKHRGIGFISSDPETFEDVVQIATTRFPGLVPHYKTPKGNVQEVDFTYLYANGHGKPYGNPLREWMRLLEIFGQKDNCKRVPEWVFEAGVVGAREFLAGYLSSDGCVKYSVQRGHITWHIHFDTVSRWLANDIQALLLRIGIIAHINNGYTSAKGTQPIYRVNVAVALDNLKRFAEQVPARGKKGKRLQQLLEQPPKGQTTSDLFGLPHEVSTYLAQDTTWRDQGRKMRRGLCLEWAERLDDPALREWGTSDLLWEEIRSIEPFGEQVVFDINVPECHNFIADGIIAHNSGQLEQEADIVMFICRDKEREDRLNILFAKHRNGPLGPVRLGFEAQHTRFYNVDEQDREVE